MLRNALGQTSDRSWNLPMRRQRTWVLLRMLELRAYAHDLTAPSSEAGGIGNILIYAQGRTGSTLLESLLCSTERFDGFHEALNTVTREVIYPVRYLRGLARLNAPRRIVVHVKPMHLCEDRRKSVNETSFLKAMTEDGWIVLHVVRRDVIKQTLSLFLAEARGRFHNMESSSEDIQFDVSPELFLKRVKARRASIIAERTALTGIPYLPVSYEDDLEDPTQHQLTIDRLMVQMGREPCEVATKLRRFTTHTAEHYIRNFDELQAHLSANGEEWPT